MPFVLNLHFGQAKSGENRCNRLITALDVDVTNTHSLAVRQFAEVDIVCSADQSPHLNSGLYVKEDQLVIIFLGFLSRKYSAKGMGSISTTAAKYIASRYLHEGAICFEKLEGQFGFILYDFNKKTGYLVADKLANYKLCYCCDKHLITISNDESTLYRYQSSQHLNNIDEDQVFQYFSGSKLTYSDTFFKNIKRVSPAAYLKITPEQAKTVNYWQLPKLQVHKDTTEAVKKFKQLMTTAVSDCIQGHQSLPVMLSGGMDSTTIAALASQLLTDKQHLWTISQVFDHFPECDERQYINLMNRKFGFDHIALPLDHCLSLFGQPEKLHHNINDIWVSPMVWKRRVTYPRLKAEGASVYLSGEFGDHLFLGHRYWLRDLLFYPARERSFFMGLYSLISAKKGLQYNREILRRLLPFNGIRAGNNVQVPVWANKQWSGVTITADEQKQYINNKYESDRYQCCISPEIANYVYMQREEANVYGLEPLNPFRDLQLMLYTLMLPAYYLYDYQQDWRKHILRIAMQGVLPEKIRTRRSKTIFDALMQTSLNDVHRHIVNEIILDSGTTWQRYVDEGFVKTCLAKTENTNDELFLLWKIICYELWYSKLRKYDSVC